MLLGILIIFVVAAALGSYMAFLHLESVEIPMPVAGLHGLLAVGGLATLAVLVRDAEGYPLGFLGSALGFFIAAAMGGFVLLAFNLRDRPFPNTLIIVMHAAMAVVGMLILLISVFVL